MPEGLRKLAECVPNFSEGRDLSVIKEITREVESTPGVTLLGVEESADYNRTVVTFVGGPEDVKMAAFKLIARAAELIDMSRQKGKHPRVGATDVCPFVPISGVTMADCIALAEALGREVGERLGIPIYLYAEAARKELRRNLADIRRGEYEGLGEKLKDPEWRPDFGPSQFTDRVKRTGATVIGARKLLIAYNIALNSPDVSIAKNIAGKVRQSGVTRKGNEGVARIPGMLKKVQALGVKLESGLTEVTMNLTDYEVTPPHVAFEAVKKEAGASGVDIVYSEIVGLVAKEPLILAGRFYGGKGNEKELIDAAVKGLLLKDFIPEKKVIEYAAGLK